MARPSPRSSHSAKTSPASSPKSKTATKSSRRSAPNSNKAAAAYRKAAAALTAERKAAAAKLAKLAEAQINSLAMKVKFQVAVTSSDQESAWTSAGWDTVEYRIATNPGEPLKPLVEIASGGELSRVLLALKVAVEEGSSSKTKKKTTPRTLVFDEIDIGIGGRAAEAVGQKLKALGRAPAGPLRHPSAADRRLRRSAPRRRKARERRPHANPHPRPRRPRPHPRSRPHV